MLIHKHKSTSLILDFFFSGTRPGTCPAPNPIPTCESTTGCESDDGCALGERCCLQWNCTKMCVKTLPPLVKSGHESEYK